jgi:hypothetical protein
VSTFLALISRPWPQWAEITWGGFDKSRLGQ